MLYDNERLDVPALVKWLDAQEIAMQDKLRALEDDLTSQCLQQENNLVTLQIGVALAHQHLHAHHQVQVLARLSIGDIAGAREIAQRVPAGSARIEINKILHEHSGLSGAGGGTLGAELPKGDLTDEHMRALLSGYSGVAGTDVIERMVAEIRRNRASLTNRLLGEGTP